jgi:hypothetical protein
VAGIMYVIHFYMDHTFYAFLLSLKTRVRAVAWIIRKGHITESVIFKPYFIFYSSRFYATQILTSGHNLLWASTWHTILECIFHPLELQHFVCNIASDSTDFFTYSRGVSTIWGNFTFFFQPTNRLPQSLCFFLISVSDVSNCIHFCLLKNVTLLPYFCVLTQLVCVHMHTCTHTHACFCTAVS